MASSKYKIHDDNYPHFITCNIIDGLPIFCLTEAVKIILDSLTFLRKEKQTKIAAYVIMENHLHAVVQSDNLEQKLSSFKSYTAKEILKQLRFNHHNNWLRRLSLALKSYQKNRNQRFWTGGFHPKQLEWEEMLIQKINYIRNNPVRRGYVDEPQHWRYSSARNYAGLQGLIEIDEVEWI